MINPISGSDGITKPSIATGGFEFMRGRVKRQRDYTSSGKQAESRTVTSSASFTILIDGADGEEMTTRLDRHNVEVKHRFGVDSPI